MVTKQPALYGTKKLHVRHCHSMYMYTVDMVQLVVYLMPFYNTTVYHVTKSSYVYKILVFIINLQQMQ